MNKVSLQRKILAKIFIFLILFLMYAPIIYITVFSFTDAEITGQWTGFSTNLYSLLFNPKSGQGRDIWSAAGNSLLVAAVSGALATVLGTFGAIGIHYLKTKWLKKSLNFITQIPIVNAEIVTAVALNVLFVITAKTFGFERSFLTLIIGHTVLGLPYVVISVIPKLEQMDPSLYEAAIDLGANRSQALWKVTIPEVLPGVLSGLLLTITLSLDDFVIAAYTKPSKGNFQTISTYVEYQMAKKGVIPNQLRAFTAILFGVILIVMIAMSVKGSLDAKKQDKLSKSKLFRSKKV